MEKSKVSVFWFRRDLRLHDNHGLCEALNGEYPVLPVFIFDRLILDELETNDARLSFIHDQLVSISNQLKTFGSSIYCLHNKPEEAWNQILNDYDVHAVYTNEDYEPYAIARDTKIGALLKNKGIHFHTFTDQVVFPKDRIVKADGKPYTVYTPYKNKWIAAFEQITLKQYIPGNPSNYLKLNCPIPDLPSLGFTRSKIVVGNYSIDALDEYESVRNFPARNQTSHLSPHLRFGTVSVREIILKTKENSTFLSELIWREFFMQILYHFPQVIDHNFKPQYDGIEWRNDPEEFEKWKQGQTGYPMVDAGMRELNNTGLMHNRVRMVTASFLCKHLLIDWRWGEAYFASRLLDYELSANNGNWQWAAGTGCDAAPYFRVFNPSEQVKKFDPDHQYIRKWIPEIDSLNYPTPMVEHKFARLRAIETYKSGLNKLP